VFYFLIGLYNPEMFMLESYASMIIDIILIIALFYIIYGLKERKYWAWKSAMLWYAFAIVYSIFFVYFLRKGIYSISSELFVISSMLIVVINGLIIWYIYHKRDYFVDRTHKEAFGLKDKFFVYCMLCFWAMLVTISLTAGVKFYRDTAVLADSLVSELRDVGANHDWGEGHSRCAAKTGAGKDVCYIVLATISDGQAAYCQEVDSQVYRFSCLQAMRSGAGW